ncbi:MAG: hypothetical protein ACHQ1D_00075 [Nitrososphaerales archaeon]
MTNQNTLVKIDPKEFGLNQSEGDEISNAFQPILDKMAELEDEFNLIISLPDDSEEAEERATEHLKLYVKIRTSSDLIHESEKSYFLGGGRFCDKWKNLQHDFSAQRESKLREIKDRNKIQEAKRIESLKHQRMIELSAYEVDGTLIALGNMSEDIWNNYLAGVKMNYYAKLELIRKAEELRIENERLDKVEQERKMEIASYAQFNSETNDLRLMSEERYVEILGNCQKAKIAFAAEQEIIRLENISLKLAADQQEARLKVERKNAEIAKAKSDAEAKKAKELSDAKIKAEKDKADALAAQLKAKADAEEVERKQEAAALKKAQAAPDKEKLKLLAKRINEIDFPLLKTEEANHIIAQVEILLNKTSEYINSKLNTL